MFPRRFGNRKGRYMSWTDITGITKSMLARAKIFSEEELDMAIKNGVPVNGIGKKGLAMINENISKKVELVHCYTGKLYADGMPKIEKRFVYCGEPDEYSERKKKEATQTINWLFRGR